MTLSRAFFTGASGLRASQIGMATVGHNIANADTEGYSRQRARVSVMDAVYLGRPGYLGQGARVDAVQRAHDAFLERQVLRDRSQLGFSASQTHTLRAAERLFSEGTQPDLGGSMGAFFDAARELSLSPSSLGHRQELLAAAGRVARAFTTLDGDVATLSAGIDADLNGRIEDINALIERVAGLNARIASDEAVADANDLRDQRDEAVRLLADQLPIQAIYGETGQVTLQIEGGFTLVQGDRARALAGVAGPAGLEVHLIGEHGPSDLTDRLHGGEVGGLLAVRQRLNDERDALDALAFSFAAEVNAVHQAGFGLDGLNGRDLFIAPAAVAGAASQMGVDPALTTAQVGAAAVGGAPHDNANAQALADLERATHAALAGRTFADQFTDQIHGLGRLMADNLSAQAQLEVRRDQSEALRESVAGVSVDEEMVDLTRFQKHFEASTRVIQTVDQMLDEVLSLVR
ncbi:flagellar hook-associated protein FlgK [Myxococcota bacterium]|nr:flagellar hook-associated protein FlgK [Myxococcota bacterium]MBU1429381.1 flagellar hook-associated protein FlgK [Myxococcota bacterium]MBU1899244.1 flagellar hook-associated protein FlgK [Myxococcota bacterium]